MRYVALASYDYGSGRAVAYASRIGWTNSGGNSISREFLRSILEWTSGRADGDTIEVCHIVVEGVDGVYPIMESVDLVSVTRRGIEFLSEDNNIDKYDCIVISGYSSSSPLVRNNLLSYVSAGGGLIVEDFRTAGSIDLLQAMAPFSVDDIGFNDEGYSVWTDEGRLTSLFSEIFLGERIPLINTIFEDTLTSWTPIIVLDTEAQPESGLDTDLAFLSSDEVDISGEYFMAYYRSVHQNGIIDVEGE